MRSRLLAAIVATFLTAAAAFAKSLIDVDDNAASFSGTWTASKAILLYYGDDYAVAQGRGVGRLRETFPFRQKYCTFAGRHGTSDEITFRTL